MKISRVRHVIITSIIFLIIILIIVTVYNNMLEEIEKDTKEMVNRVIATEDIMPGDMITVDNVTVKQVQNIVGTQNLVYRLYKNEACWESVDDTNAYMNGEIKLSYPTDDRWADGKIATSKIYKGEMIVADDLRLSETIAAGKERIYSIPFDSLATGGYNVNVGDKVDICLLYNANDKSIKDYQELEENKVIDIVLAKKEIMDIRDESGNSKKDNSAVVPGYICFKLSYDEINKIELAKRQGKVFVGIVDVYSGDPHEETFMLGETLPTFETKDVNP